MANFLPKRDEEETIHEYARRCAGPLKEAQDYWARVLRLQDWDITSEITTEEKVCHLMKGDDFTACCQVGRIHKEADIYLAVDEAGEKEFVHEMLHIVLDDLEQRANSAIDAVESESTKNVLREGLSESLERTINMLAKALLAARDGGR